MIPALLGLVALLVAALLVQSLLGAHERAERDALLQRMLKGQCEMDQALARDAMDRMQARTLTEYRLQPDVEPIPGEAARDPVDPDWEEPNFRRPQEKVPLGLDGEE